MVKLRIMTKSRTRGNYLYLGLFLSLFQLSTNGEGKDKADKIFDLFFSSAEETQNFIEQNHFRYKQTIDLVDLVSFGGYRTVKNVITRLMTNYTNLVVSKKELDDYALLQKKRLLHFFKNINEDTMNYLNNVQEKKKSVEDMEKKYRYKDNYDVIRDIVVDFSVYGGNNGKIQENFYILEEYINNYLSQRLINTILKDKFKDKSASFRLRYYTFLYGLNFQINSYWSKFMLNMIMPDISFLSTSSSAKNLLYKFSEKSFTHLIATYEAAISMISVLEEEKDEEKLKVKLGELLTKTENEIKKIESSPEGQMIKMLQGIDASKFGMSGEINNLLEGINRHKKKEEAIKEQQKNTKQIAEDNRLNEARLRRIFTEGVAMAMYDTPGLDHVADFFKVLSSPFKSNKAHEYSNYDEFIEKYFKDVKNADETEVELIKQLIHNQDMKRVYKRRNQIFFDRAKEDYLQQNDIYILSILMPYIKRYLEDKLKDKVTDIISGVFFDVTELASKQAKKKYVYAFPEDMIINKEENKKLEMFLTSALYSIKHNEPIPHVIFHIFGDDSEKHVKSIIKDIFLREKIVFYTKNIINPVFLTNFYVKLTTSTEGKKKKIDMLKLTNTIFRRNINSFRSLLESYFIGEKYNYLPWFSQVLHQSVNILYSMEKYAASAGSLLGNKIVTMLDISGFEFLCRDRSSNSAYSLASLIYIDLVNHQLKDVTIMAYTERLDQIDRAVLSRIPFQISFRKIEDRETCFIVVRRLILDLMRVKKLNFESQEMEEVVFNLAGVIYMEDYEIEDVYDIFRKIAKSKTQEIRIKDIMNIFKKQVKEETKE